MASALQRWEPETAIRGISDLAIGEMKISGNAQRRQRRGILLHGTILYGMQADLIGRYLKHPKRIPDYRGNRPHTAFLKTMDASPHELKQAIAALWRAARDPEDALPHIRLSRAIAAVLKRSLPVEGEQG